MEAERLLNDGAPAEQVAVSAAAEVSPADDVHATAAYRRAMTAEFRDAWKSAGHGDPSQPVVGCAVHTYVAGSAAEIDEHADELVRRAQAEAAAAS